MNESIEYTSQFWPVVVYGAIVLSLVGAMLGLSYLLGQRHNERATGEPYEGGILSTGSASLRFSSQFYLIAMLFVIFDVDKKDNDEALAAVKKSGRSQLITLTPQERAAWKKAMDKTHKENMGRIGADIMKEVYKETGYKAD